MAIQQQEKPRFRARLWKSFVTSSWLTTAWEWFLSLAGRAVQLVLFVTVMYNLASTYPGFKAPWSGLDMISFILQNVALDVGSFGLPKLADQAEQDGNVEGAEKARKVAKALFYIMIANLIWGGFEHVFPAINEAMKTIVGLGFVITRAWYATEYMRVIHGLKHEEVDATTQHATTQTQQAMLDANNELRAWTQTTITETQGAIQMQLAETQLAILEKVRDAMQSQNAIQMQTAMSELRLIIQEETQGAIQMQLAETQQAMQAETQRIRNELRRVRITEIEAQHPALVAPQQTQHANGATPETQHANGATPETQHANGATPETQHATAQVQCFTETQGAQVQHVSAETQHANDEEPRTDCLPVLRLVDATTETQGGNKEAVFSYIEAQLAQGYTPTVQDVIGAIGCKERTAQKYRRQALDELLPVQAK